MDIKHLRSSLLDDLVVSLDQLPIVLIGGRTCSGKTIALKHMSRYVDLEGLANHCVYIGRIGKSSLLNSIIKTTLNYTLTRRL